MEIPHEPPSGFHPRSASGAERQRLRDSFSELQERVRETVDPRELMRAHAALSLLVVAVAGFALGYRLASGFTRP
jgi:hypothetical protein